MLEHVVSDRSEPKSARERPGTASEDEEVGPNLTRSTAVRLAGLANFDPDTDATVKVDVTQRAFELAAGIGLRTRRGREEVRALEVIVDGDRRQPSSISDGGRDEPRTHNNKHRHIVRSLEEVERTSSSARGELRCARDDQDPGHQIAPSKRVIRGVAIVRGGPPTSPCVSANASRRVRRIFRPRPSTPEVESGQRLSGDGAPTASSIGSLDLRRPTVLRLPLDQLLAPPSFSVTSAVWNASRSVWEVQRPRRGRLLDSSRAPAQGERVEHLTDLSGVRIQHILSGEINQAVSYTQDHDEWFVLLRGDADIEVAGERLALRPGDWMLLPRATPHRVLRTAPGTTWLTVHGGHGDPDCAQ